MNIHLLSTPSTTQPFIVARTRESTFLQWPTYSVFIQDGTLQFPPPPDPKVKMVPILIPFAQVSHCHLCVWALLRT